jgi:hypothetical protein
MMKQKLKVSFDNPEHGWVGLTISQGEESLTIVASYTPSDSFLDLTNALYNLLCYRVGGFVTWHEELAETEMRFSISVEEVEARWHLPFPWKEIDLLTAVIKEGTPPLNPERSPANEGESTV